MVCMMGWFQLPKERVTVDPESMPSSRLETTEAEKLTTFTLRRHGICLTRDIAFLRVDQL